MDKYDFIVIGSGPAGQRAAIQAAKLGKRVAIIERKTEVGGVSLHTGTIPSKTLRESVLHLSGWRLRALQAFAGIVLDNLPNTVTQVGKDKRAKKKSPASDITRPRQVLLMPSPNSS